MNSQAINLNTFRIKTPADGGDYELSLGDIAISSKTLKFGVIKLFNKIGAIPGGTAGVEYQLIDIIKGQPESRQKRWLLSILDNIKPESMPPLPPEAHQEPPNQQESPDTPAEAESPPHTIVTFNTAPVKPPYHRRGQSTIYDSIIDAAIAAGGSLRGIAGALKDQGIVVSHMTISRRINHARST